MVLPSRGFVPGADGSGWRRPPGPCATSSGPRDTSTSGAARGVGSGDGHQLVVYIYIYIHTYIYIYLCIYVCMYVCIYIYIYGFGPKLNNHKTTQSMFPFASHSHMYIYIYIYVCVFLDVSQRGIPERVCFSFLFFPPLKHHQKDSLKKAHMPIGCSVFLCWLFSFFACLEDPNVGGSWRSRSRKVTSLYYE